MKKSLMKIAGALLAAAALFFTGCSNGSGYSAAIDTVTSLEKPVIKVTAYPGMNYVSWTSVTGATSYYLTVYEDGVERYSSGAITRTYSQNCYVDYYLQDGHSYKYRVEAVSKTNPAGSRAVYVTNSAAESETVKAIVPIAETEAIAFTEFDTSKNSTDYVVDADGINVGTSKGYIRVSLPTKAYLQYYTFAESENYVNAKESNELSGATLVSIPRITSSTYFNPSANNVNPTNFSMSVATPGVYKIGVLVFTPIYSNTRYPVSEIYATKQITIPGIITSVATGNVNYKWVSSDKARLYWTPATLADGTTAKAENYIVYTYDADNYTLTKVEGTVAPLSDEDYYFDVTPAEDTTYVVAYTEVVTELDETETIYVESRSTVNKVTVNVATMDIAAAPVSSDVYMVAGEDGIANDAVFSIQVAKDTVLKEVKYAVIDTATTYAALLDSEYKAITTFPEGDEYYEIDLCEDVEVGKYVVVKYTVSAEGYEDYVDYVVSSTASGEPSLIAAAPVSNTLTIVAADDDEKANDAKVAIMLAEDTKLTSVVYATSDVSAAKARLLLNNVSDVTEVKFEEGYSYYVLTINDIAEGDFVAVKAVIAQDGCKDKVVTLSSTTAIDTSVTASDISIASSNFIDADNDGNANDYEIVYLKKPEQTVKMFYATSEESGSEAVKLTYSKAAKAVTNVTTDTDFGEYGAIYVAVLKDIPVDNYVGIRYTISETDKVDYSVEYASTTTSGIYITTDTADPIASPSEIALVADDEDANYNDATEAFEIEIAFDQTIKSIVYATADSKEIAEISVATEKNTTAIALPGEYELKTTYDNPTVLTKVYTINPNVKNIADGDYIVVGITLAEEGYNDNLITIVSDNYAAQKAVTVPAVTIGDAYNYEYVDVLVTDDYPYDSVGNYTYTIQWTTEKQYKEADPVWVKLPNTASTAFDVIEEKDDDENVIGYRFAKRYFIDTLGDYVIRVTKTRKASASITGEEESVVSDSKFTVVDIPCTDLVTYNVNGSYEYVKVTASEMIYTDYDDVTNYTYKLYEVAVTDDPETTEDEVSDFMALDDDAKAEYLEANWKDSIAVKWVLDADASDSVTESNNLAGYINPTVKLYTFENRFVKEVPGVYCYKLTKERSTPAGKSDAVLYTESTGADNVARIPNNDPTIYYNAFHYGEATINITDVFANDYDSKDNWKYEVQYILTTDYDPSLNTFEEPDGAWGVPAVKTVAVPFVSEVYDEVTDTTEVSYSKTVAATPDSYTVRVIKTRVQNFVTDEDSEKKNVSSSEVVDISYAPVFDVTVADGDTFQFTVTGEDKFNSSVDSLPNWNYYVSYYKTADEESVWDGTITPTVKQVYLGYKETADGVETDDVTAIFDINVPADTDYVVNVYKVPLGYSYSDAEAYSVSKTVTVKYANTVTITADTALEIAYSVEDYVEDIGAVAYKVVYAKKAEPEVTTDVVIYPAVNAAGRYEVSDVIDLSAAGLTEDTEYTVTVYKDDVVLKTVDVTVTL